MLAPDAHGEDSIHVTCWNILSVDYGSDCRPRWLEEK